MFAPRYFAVRFFAPRYFPPSGAAIIVSIVRQIMRQHALSSKMDIGI